METPDRRTEPGNEFREQTLDEMQAGLESRELDAAVAAISVTAERHQRIKFCHRRLELPFPSRVL